MSKVFRENQRKPKNYNSLVGRIAISGINRQSNKIMRDHFLNWLVKNGWKDLVVIEVKKPSAKEKIEFIPCEFQSNSLQTFSYKTAPDEFVADLIIFIENDF